MNTITLFVNFKREYKDDVLLALKCFRGKLIDTSDVLNLAVFQTSSVYINKIKRIDGVTIVTDKFGGYVER